MADAGFEVINDDNILVINQDYMNLAFTRKVQVSTLPYWFADINTKYMIEGSKFSCRKLVLGENEDLAYLGGVKGNGSIDGFATIDLYAATNGQKAYYVFLRKGVDATKLYMYVFGKYGNNTDSIRYGLQVFDESENLVYSSNIKPLKVLHHSNTNDGYTVDSTKKVAINIVNVTYSKPFDDIGAANTPLYVDGHWWANPCVRDLMMPYMSRYFYSSVPAIINGKVQRRAFNNDYDGWLGSYTEDSWNGFIYTIVDVTDY